MKFLKYSYLLFLLCLTQSCDKGFEELNVDPLSPTEAQDGPIFNSIVESLKLGWNRQLFLHNEKLYDVTELAVVTAATFGNEESGAEDVWSNYYTALRNARDLENRFANYSGDFDATNIVRAQLKILMAYKTFQITDLFGSIPYTEAGRAYDGDFILRPKYDDHELIYKSLIDDLFWAVDILNNSGTTTSSGESYLSYGSFETLFGNNLGQWSTFANSLLLRYLVRIYDVAPDYVAPKVKGLIDNGANFITEGGDIVMLPSAQGWSNEGVNWSFREHNKVRMGSTIWKLMTADDSDEILDPRLAIFYEPNNAGEWKAFPQIPNEDTPQSGGTPYSNARDQNYDDKGAGNIYASVNYYLIRDEDHIPEILMTSAEVRFLLSEIFLRGIGVAADASNADFNYQLGMLESMKFWTNIVENSQIWVNRPFLPTIAEMYAIVTHPKYSLAEVDDEASKLERIYTQRWVDTFRQPWEAFSLLRRTNKVPREKTQNTFNRFKYPPSELNFNAENYNAQLSKMGGDLNTVKLWWMD